MAFQDKDYIKAPYLQVGDYLKINGTPSGFYINSDTTRFISGTNDGTLTLGRAGMATSILVLDINAKKINWNGRSLEDYFTSSSADYMTAAETNSAIASYSIEGGYYNLGTLVENLTTSHQYSLVKGGTNLLFETSGMYLSADASSLGSAEMSFTPTGVTALLNKNSTGIAELYIGKDSTGLLYSKKTSVSDLGSTVAQLVLSPGKVNMQLVDSSALQGRYEFNLNAALPIDNSSDTGVQMAYHSRGETEPNTYTSSMGMNGYKAELRVGAGSDYMGLHLTSDAFRIESPESVWDGLIGTESHAVPTVSVVHYLIQSALANQ